MTPNLDRVKLLFQQAVDLPPAERSQFLESKCGSDSALRSEVESLLAHDECRTIDALQTPAYQPKITDESTEAAPAAGVLPQHIGRFRIIEQIAEGGMGIVYRAEQEQPKREVALKVIRHGMTSRQMLRRFEHEAHVLGQLQHPGIAQIYEAGVAEVTTVGQTSKQPFFAMEFIRGRTLIRHAQERTLSTRDRLELLANVCDAVQHAHQKGVIHRDLKPGNILVDEHGQPKVLDFGVARVTEADMQTVTMQTDVGQLVGTIPYMSPEQVSGRREDLDTRSDVYALGVILYELLAGKLPCDVRGLSIPEAARVIQAVDASKLSTVDIRYRGDIETMVAKALEKDRDRRYASAAEFAADLRRYLGNEPIVAHPSSITYQLGKFAKRHRVVVVSGATVLLILIAASVFSAWVALREFKQRQIADRQRQIAEKRFDDVRELAGTFIFEIEDKIRFLPGSTEAREALVKTALRYLDELAVESQSEPELLQELAQAYRRVGHVQGSPNMPNVGDVTGALDSFRKSLEILEQLGGATATDPTIDLELFDTLRDLGEIFETLGRPEEALRSLSRAHHLAGEAKLEVQGLPRRSISAYKIGRIHERSGRPAEALFHYLESHALREAALRSAPENLELQRSVAITSNKIGDMLVRDGRLDEALERFRESHEMRRRLTEARPDDALFRRDLSLTHGRIGDTLATMGRIDEALVHFEAYRQIRADLAAADSENANAQRDLAVSEMKLFGLYRALERPVEALTCIQHASDLLGEISRADPENFALRHDVTITCLMTCEILADMERLEEALADLTKCLATVETLRQTNPDDTEVRHTHGTVYALLGRILQEAGRFEDARENLRMGLSLRESLIEIDPNRPMFQGDLLETLHRLGDVCVTLAQRADYPGEQRLAFWREAGSFYRRAGEIAADLHEQGLLQDDGTDQAAVLAAAIAKCDAAIAGIVRGNGQ